MIGKKINRYEIVSKIGEGGMGTVWLAEDPLLDRKVAIKFLPESVSDSENAKERFLREARAASNLNHSGIATVFDAGEADGKVYIAFRFVEGESVAKRIHGHGIGADDAVRIAIDVCDALHYAHVNGILHRDVSAGNVMIGKDGRAIVVDFGLALPEGATRLTKSGSIIGTTAYMSPEALEGMEIDQRSDIYGIGAVLYEMLTGSLPFVADNLKTIMYKIVNEEPESPSARCGGLSEQLDKIVLKALSKSTDSRYQSAHEFANDLRVYLGMAPVEEPASSPKLRKKAFGKLRESDLKTVTSVGHKRQSYFSLFGSLKNRSVSMYAMFVIALLAAITVIVVLNRPFFQEKTISVAVLPLKMSGSFSEESSWIAEGISSSIASRLTNLIGVHVTPWVTSQRYSEYSDMLTEVAAELGVQRLIIGDVRIIGERVMASIVLIDPAENRQIWASEFSENASDIFEVQTKIAMGAAAGLKGTISDEEERLITKPPALTAEAFELYIKGSLKMQEDTPEANDIALAYFDRAIELDPELVDAHTGRGAIYSNRFFRGWGGGKQSLDDAEFNYKKALDIYPSTTNARRGLVRVFWERGLSEECLKQGAAISKDLDNNIEGLFVRADAYLLGGMPDRAVSLYERILDLDRANRGALWHLQIALSWSNQPEKSLDAGETFFERFGEDPEVHTWVAVSHHILGNSDAALIHYERAIELFGKYPNLYTESFVSALLLQQGDTTSATAYLISLAKRLEQSLKAYPSNFSVTSELVICYALLGNKIEANKLFEQAMGDSIYGGPFTGGVFLAYTINPSKKKKEILNGQAKSRDFLFLIELLPSLYLSSENRIPVSELEKEDWYQSVKKLNAKHRAMY